MTFSTEYILQDSENPKSIRFARIEFQPSVVNGVSTDCIILPEKNNTVKYIRTTLMILQTNGFGDDLQFFDLSLKNKRIFTITNVVSTIVAIPFEYVFKSDKLSIRMQASLNAKFSIAYQRVYEQ